MKKAFKIILNLIINLAILGGLVFVFRTPLQNLRNRFQAQYFPCSQPIAYSLGAFDKKFGISEKDFLSAIDAAEQVWEKPIGKDLFEYGANGPLKINLIYDIRQEATHKLQALDLSVSDDKASYNSIKTKYNTLRAQYLVGKTALDAKIAAFEIMKNKYEAEVRTWNARGGANKEAYARLEADRLALNAAASDINQMQDALNAKIENINAMVVVLNRLATSLNITADTYNQIGDQLGGEFAEGTYQSGPEGERIDIYQFDNRAKLIRVLAHELGHALGLDHAEDQKAIMYRLNNGVNDKLTESDLALVKTHCQIK
jgi:predicted Zn-dependent protease